MRRDMNAEKKVMDYLLDHMGEKQYLSQIARSSGTSGSTCHQILEKKFAEGLVKKEKLGNLSLYFLNSNDLMVRQRKVARTIESLSPLVKRLENISQKIILFGSAAQGIDTADSDVDLCILTAEKEEAREMVRKAKLRRKIQVVYKNYLEWVKLKKEDRVFYDEISKGRVLWEEKYGKRI